MTNNYDQDSILLHEKFRGKIESRSKVPLNTREDLSLAYTPGVAAPCREIHKNPEKAHTLTCKGNSVAIVTDGSAVLGLGNIGPLAALPVMEGKALLFKRYADVDAWPICLDTQDVDEIVDIVTKIAPTFGAINLEDISAPHCFAVTERLQKLDIPVFHDDQHGTAIVVLAALINAAKVTGLDLPSSKIVVSGAGAAGIAIAHLLCKVGYEKSDYPRVFDVIVVDSQGVISDKRANLTPTKQALLEFTNRNHCHGSLADAMEGAHAFIGVSQGGIVSQAHIQSMEKDPIVLALANPIPEIMPQEALEAGAAVVGTGRSDFPNQVNNVLAFPGIFRGALDARVSSITPSMLVAAVQALVQAVPQPNEGHILPDPLNFQIGHRVGEAVRQAALSPLACSK